MTNMKDKENEKLRQLHRSILIAEVKEKVRMLKELGMSDGEIVSSLRISQSLKKLVVSKNYRLFLDEERKEVHMEPLVKAVYLLFLKHPEGIVFKDLPDYRMELADIYNKVRPWGLTDRALRSIEDVTNPLLNSINEKCSRIRRAFLAHLDSNIAEQYYIRGTRGASKGIALPRDKVVWE